MPRPRGRSGCVTTRAHGKPGLDQLFQRRDGECGSAAENEIERSRHQTSGPQTSDRELRACRTCLSRPTPDTGSSLPLSRFHQLADLALHQVALQRADVADVQLAVQVIGLMQEGARQQIFAGLLEPLAVHVLRADGHLARARHRLAKFGNAQAAFGSASGGLRCE